VVKVTSMKKLIASLGIAASLGVGAFALNTVSPAGASPSLAQSSAQTSSTGSCPQRVSLKDVLDGLVKDGTISQDQQDKIVGALKAAHDSNKQSSPQKSGPAAPRVRAIQGALDVSANKIGVSVDELKTAVKGGQSVADVATAHTVDPASVEQAIVDAATSKIDEAAANGRLTEQQASALKDRVPEMANRFVNHKGADC
jgi:polyhydroxyalkanoate synthesis regulator phasin